MFDFTADKKYYQTSILKKSQSLLYKTILHKKIDSFKFITQFVRVIKLCDEKS